MEGRNRRKEGQNGSKVGIEEWEEGRKVRIGGKKKEGRNEGMDQCPSGHRGEFPDFLRGHFRGLI